MLNSTRYISFTDSNFIFKRNALTSSVDTLSWLASSLSSLDLSSSVEECCDPTAESTLTADLSDGNRNLVSDM